MAIKIGHKLSNLQYIKLFSNPVSGIACTIDDTWGLIHGLGSIRYSKSMVVNALRFWEKQLSNYYEKYERYKHPLELENNILTFEKRKVMSEIRDLRFRVFDCPETYLFSHRYIVRVSTLNSEPLKRQRKLLVEKTHVDNFEFQKVTMDPFYQLGLYSEIGLTVSVFPNIHPYIPKQKIAKVGKTAKGNVYVIHEKRWDS